MKSIKQLLRWIFINFKRILKIFQHPDHCSPPKSHWNLEGIQFNAHDRGKASKSSSRFKVRGSLKIPTHIFVSVIKIARLSLKIFMNIQIVLLKKLSMNIRKHKSWSTRTQIIHVRECSLIIISSMYVCAGWQVFTPHFVPLRPGNYQK